jgi:ribosome biogenesis GTPase / thiamine phosphate phosphatase
MTSPQPHGLDRSRFFAAQLEPDDAGLVPVRIAAVHRSRLMAGTGTRQIGLDPQAFAKTIDYAVGDWVLMEPGTRTALRRLVRRTLLRRRTESSHAPQLIAANVDTLVIVTPCNDDFNPAPLERYLPRPRIENTGPQGVHPSLPHRPRGLRGRDAARG